MNEQIETLSKETDRKLLLGNVVTGLLNELKRNSSSISKIADRGLKETFLFSGKYSQWFMEFTKKDIILLEFLLDYQRLHRHEKLNSYEEKMISDIYLEFLSDENYPDSFEATFMFTEMQLNMEPPSQVKKCVTSPNFLNVVTLAVKIGKTMRGYEEILSSTNFYDKFTHTIEQISTKKQEKSEKVNEADVIRNLNVVIAVLYEKMKGLNYTFKTTSNLPKARISFESLMKVWLYIIESLIETIICPKKNEMGISVFLSDDKSIVVEFFVVCDATDVESKIEAFKSMKISDDEKFTYDYNAISKMIDKSGGNISFSKNDDSSMICRVEFPSVKKIIKQ